MPSLQLDLPLRLDLDTKRDLARELGAIYADVMDTRPDIITISFHELDEGGIWRCSADDPTPAALVMCDIRAGRPAATRGMLAERIVKACAEATGLHPHQLKVEYTQHAGDEMFHPHLGGFNTDWQAGESSRPLEA
jgi:phenylpyruvate tautomerase PptA (4-oxalocrotonate tautomerase family)